MSAHAIFYARAALACVCAVLTLVAVNLRWPYLLSVSRFDRVFLATASLTRLGLFYLIYGIAHQVPRGDVAAYYLPSVLHRLQGGVPYRDFVSSYAPLYTYFYGLLYRVHASGAVFVFFAILAELLSLALWLQVSRHCFSEKAVRTSALLYLFNPISIEFIALDGQNNAWIVLLLAASLLMLKRRLPVASGLAYAASVVAVKFLPLIWMPTLLLHAGRARWRWLASCVILIALVYGYFALRLGANVLQPVLVEGAFRTAGGFPYLFEALTGMHAGNAAWDGLLACVLLSLIGWEVVHAQRNARPFTEPGLRHAVIGIPLYLTAVMLFGKKTWPEYSVLCLFPLLLVIGERLSVAPRLGRTSLLATLTLFTVVSVSEQSFWAQFLNHDPAWLLHGRLIRADSAGITQILMEITLLACYGWLIWCCVRLPETTD